MVRKCIEFTSFRKTAKYGATHNVFRYGLKKKKEEDALDISAKAGGSDETISTHTYTHLACF